MKNIKPTLFTVAIAILLSSCSATNQLTMRVLEPAPVYVASDIQNVGIINRSLPSEENKTLDKIDQILSAEGLHLDRLGSGASVEALRDQLVREQRFKKVIIIDSLTHERKGLGVLPATLSWEQVEALCKANGVDIIFSLEFYDTDTKIDYQLTTLELPNSIGIKASIPGHQVTLETLIKNGWRIYDPQTKDILDEYLGNRRVVSAGKGINPIKAVEAVLGRKEAVIQQSKHIGSAYALRLFPSERRIARNYFVRGSDKFIVAKRRAQTGDWQGAAVLWEQEITNRNSKIAGRAYYNMAISNEINGNLESAMEWASKSYSDYRNRNALDYLNILRYRMAQKEELENQVMR